MSRSLAALVPARPPRPFLGVAVVTLGCVTTAVLGAAALFVRAQDGAIAASAPPTAAVGGWSIWAPVGGPASLSPSLAFNPTAGTLELVKVGQDKSVTHNRLVGGAWSSAVATGRQTSLPPVILTDEAGVPQCVATGPDGVVVHSRFQGGAWSAGPPMPAELTSNLPPAAVLNSAAKAVELITVGKDGGVLHSRLIGGVWSSAVPLNANTSLPPALAVNPAGGLELAFVRSDKQVFHSRFSGSQWSDPAPTKVFTEMAPALAVSADGVVHLAATGLDKTVVHSRFTNNAWTDPVTTKVQTSVSPAIVFSAGGNSLELLAPGSDHALRHGRFTGGAWADPVSLGMTTDVPAALTAGAGPALDAAVLGTDGQVYASHFQGAAAVAVSFQKDILRIFTNNGAKTCTNCHKGASAPEGMTLEAAKAYGNIVNVASKEKTSLKRVQQGDANNSYLYQKVVGKPTFAISGSRMPLSGGALTDADIALIRDWINAGAPNN